MKLTGQKTRARQKLITVDDFKGGYNNLVDEARMNQKFAVQSNNLMQVQDGIWKTRWGNKYYGADYGVNPDGASEFVKSDGSTELIVVAGGKAYKSTDGGSTTEITGATFTAGTKCYFMQISGYLYISNGTDSLARYNGTVLSTYTEIAAPANLTASLVASGLSSGAHSYYAEVTAINSIGETVGSTEASITTCKVRANWTANVDKVSWQWETVAGADRYQLYLSDESGFEYALASTPNLFYEDDGTVALNPYVVTPLDNTTGAPKFKSMTISGNRIWGTNDPDNRYTVYWSGTGQDMGKFSDFYGGGWIRLEAGGRETPVSVKHYQSGSGEGIATVLCKTPDGRGAVWQIDIGTTTVGDYSFPTPSADKVVGSWGTESIDGVVATDNNIGFPNRKGWFFLGPQQNYFGILRTEEKSSNIRPYWRNLKESAIDGIAAYYYDAKVFISVPNGTSTNNKTIILDTERNNWAVEWNIGAKQFLEYTDTTGNSKFLYIPTSGTKLVELSSNFTGDFTGAITQSYTSPLIPVSKNKTDILNLREAIVELGQPSGSIDFSVLGVGKDSAFTTLATSTISDFGANTGVGADLAGELHPTSTRANVSGGDGAWALYLLEGPSTFAQSITKRAIKKRAKLYGIQFKVESTTADTEFSILSFQAKGSIIPRRLPSVWTN